MFIEQLFVLTFTLMFFLGVYGYMRYRTAINPLTFFVFLNFGVFTILSAGVSYYMIPMRSYGNDSFIETYLYATVYMLAFASSYTYKSRLLPRLYRQMLAIFMLKNVNMRFSMAKVLVLIGVSICSYIALAVIGGGGILWLTDTRYAYQNYRSGAGIFFTLSQWLLIITYLYYFWMFRPKSLLKIIFLMCVYIALISFLGSKANIIGIIILTIVYYNFYVKRLSLFFLSFSAITGFLFFLLMQILQKSSSGAINSLFYFRDYFNTTAMFISRFDEFQHMYGSGWVSSLWGYVPRILYSDKPYEYGNKLIHEVLFPGMAELGHTPGILSWALSYLDYGLLGIVISGFLYGVFSKVVYEHFLKNKECFFSFILMVQLTLWQILIYSPVIVTFFLLVLFSMFFRLVIYSKKN
jgi:oligosaccharide repeat unit polymerase